MTIVKPLHIVDMEKKDPQKYKQYDSSSDTSSVASDESLESVSGPNFADFARQLAYQKSPELIYDNYFFPVEKNTQATSVKEQTYLFPSTFLETQDAPKSTEVGKIFAPKTADLTTLFLIDSLNRDKTAFPQPTSFTLKLPRVHRNVKSISMTQIKLLCSFYYFSDSIAKSNIYLPIRERGRESIARYNGAPLTKVVTIRQGTYGIGDLLNEIQTALNYTPLFYDFPNGFADFIKIFTVNGDYSINFNQPGDTYYDALNSKVIQNPTLANIVSYYWGSRYAGLTYYTTDQSKVSYYYPVLYEVLLDLKDTTIKPSLKLNVPDNLLGPGETVYSHIIFNMSGIDDAVALYLINNNIPLLDIYRLNHTFRSSLINRYQLAYDTNSLQVNFTTISLNTSLVNLINNTGSSALASALADLGLTTSAYTTLQTTVSKATVVYAAMYQFLQQQLIKYVGIPFAKYAPQFFNNLDNILYFQDGINAIGVRTGYTSEYLTSGEIPVMSNVAKYYNSPVYWPNMDSTNPGSGYPATNFDTAINPYKSMIPYNSLSKNFQFGETAIDSSNYFFNTNKATGSLDLLVNVLPAQYSIFKFRSSARQTLQVETLPLPYYYRYSDYNKQGKYKGVLDLDKNNVPQQYFDISYNFVYSTINKSMDNSRYVQNILTPIFGQTFQNAFSDSKSFVANSQSNYNQFEFIAPYPPGITSGIYANNTSLSFVSILSGNISTLFPDSFKAFIYHDRAAFMADLEFPRTENPLHYIQVLSTNSTASAMTVHFSTFSGHTYYTIFRSDNLACSNTTYAPVVSYNDSSYVQVATDYVNFDPTSNPYSSSNINNYPFVTNYNPDFTRLPTNSSMMGLDPNSSTFNVNLVLQGDPIGYDISGVSDDLTDYIGYNTIASASTAVDLTTRIRIDPLSLYSFQYISPFEPIQGTYFGSNTSNSILEPVTNNIYGFKGTSTSQLKIVHWYGGYSVPRQLDDPFTSFNSISTVGTSNITQYIKSYPVNSNGNIMFGRGINAIGFLPRDGQYDVSTFSFKSSIYPLKSEQSVEDPNLQIAYIGVFSGLNLTTSFITISSAITVLKFQSSIAYGPTSVNTSPTSEYGTWYTFQKDPNFVSQIETTVSGYTPGTTELLSYNSMYYMVPFSASGNNLTYSILSGSLVAYPSAYSPSTVSSFYNQTTQSIPGTTPQIEYIVPTAIPGALSKYGPQGSFTETQSQYAQSIPINTPSIGYKEYPFLVNDGNALFSFNTSVPTFDDSITTFTSEYNDTLYIVNASSINCSNTSMSYSSAFYASSLSTLIQTNGGTNDCIKNIVNPPPTLQNYSITGSVFNSATFAFETQLGLDRNVTIRKYEFLPTMSNITMWLWGGGGGTWLNSNNISGGAGAYAKVDINFQNLLNTKTIDCPGGISTLYMVVGKGGNRNNPSLVETVGSLQLYEQARYGGGGTSILGNFTSQDSLGLQGGGFSGIFTGSNLLTATPLLIVGGGGAAGAYNLGGPGGFGVEPTLLPTQNYSFSTATFSGLFYNPLTISSISDVFNNPVLNFSTIQNTIDGNLTTYWNPSYPPKMNPQNYLPTNNTYGVKLQFSAQPTSLSKIRYCGPNLQNTSNIPSGFLLYNDVNKKQLLYSNTSIHPLEFKQYNNGSFSQHIYDIIPSAQVIPQTISSMAWLVAGINTTSQTSIQYSTDKTQWIPTNNTNLTSYTSIQYVSEFLSWYATGQKIMKSSDGINWSECVVVGFSGTQFNTIASGLNIILAGGNDGSIFITTDGTNWSYTGTKFSQNVTRIRFINNIFWSIGSSNSPLRRSVDGISWTSVGGVSISGMNDISYGLGRYVIAQENNTVPFRTPLIYSQNGITWTSTSPVNINGFTANSIIFANNQFVAVGLTTDGSSFIKYSRDGINWINSTFSSTADLQRNNIEYLGNVYVSVGKTLSDTGLAGNQLSIITSLDGVNWSYTLSGGFDPDLGSPLVQGNSVGYGPITVLPNLSTLYLEIQTTSSQPYIYELKAYDTSMVISGNTSTLIDNNLTTVFYPLERDTLDVIEYPFSFTSLNITKMNSIQVYVIDNASTQFSGVTVNLDGTSNTTIYSDFNVNSFANTTTVGIKLYEITLAPNLENISSLGLTFMKTTPGSLQIAGIVPAYNPNKQVLEIPITSVQDLDNRPVFSALYSISKITDTDLNTYWYPRTFTPGTLLKLNIGFTAPVERINRIQIYNGNYPPLETNTITSIALYSDINKTIEIYSNSNLVFKQYKNISLIEFDIPEIFGYNSLYIELGKITQGIPFINSIKFFNIGTVINTANGFTSGNTVTMYRNTTALSPYDGGGGSSNLGGYGGPRAYLGNYLIGGSPAILESQLTLSNTSNIVNGSGGGGGGYYGGGGGGINGLIGGGGGGGSGFINNSTSIFTLLDYGVASPGFKTTYSNYVVPGKDEQMALVRKGILQPPPISYGQGGNPSVDSGKGANGIIVIQYSVDNTINPPVSSDLAIPSFIDGSQLVVYEAPIEYFSDTRKISFSIFQNSLQNTQYANYNWVWYNSFLSLVGCSLTPSLQPSSQTPVRPIRDWPNLPSQTFTDLSNIFPQVVQFYLTPITLTTVSGITSELTRIFQNFQNIFIQSRSTDVSYREMTELYCLLDYLRKSSNLSQPHAATGSLDRLLGGIPRFGYWANPFFTNVSYIGFDIASGQIPTPSLSTLIQNSLPVKSIYGLVLEQDLVTGAYIFKDIMAYKPTALDPITWQTATQFTDTYVVRLLANAQYLESNIPVQPYTFRNAINARLPLFKYSVYTIPANIDTKMYNIPTHILNDFQGTNIYMYSFQNTVLADISSINISKVPFTSTMLQLNQQNINQQAVSNPSIIGTLVSEDIATTVYAVTSYGFTNNNYKPNLQFTTGVGNYYNSMGGPVGTALNNIVGKALNDVYGNYYITKNDGSSELYENICTTKVYPQAFANSTISYASPKYVLSQYSVSENPYSDFFFSKFSNIWHFSAKGILDTIYGARLTSPYDFNIKTNFLNQVFYPVHKISLVKTGTLVNPIKNIGDNGKYPSFQHTEMFFYKNYSTMVKDIGATFAQEKASNFSYADINSGYSFNSYIYNINMPKSSNYDNNDSNSFNYLAIRAYSPSETFQTMVRFYLPQRYDFGYISLRDLSNEQLIVNTAQNVNPDYKAFLSLFNQAFSTTQIYGTLGVPGFSGSNISTVSFGDFITQYNNVNLANQTNSGTISTITGRSNAAISKLITGDLQYIMPSYLANRNRTTDPIEFMIPFSTCVTPSNASIDQYGMGYNLGFAFADTLYNTVQRATSFFKLLDDSIFLRLNEEFGMNKMDISQPEKFAQTRDTTAQSGLYNSKLILNSFGSFATTFVQSPVTFNPPIGKIDTLSFSWYNSSGVLLNNNDCDWSGSVQIVESVNAPLS